MASALAIEPSAASRRAAHINVAIAVAVGALAVPMGAVAARYFAGIDNLMNPRCSVGTETALAGIGVASAVVAFASILLVRRFALAGAHRPIGQAARAWAISASLWFGVGCCVAYLVTHTQSGVLTSAGCHL